MFSHTRSVLFSMALAATTLSFAAPVKAEQKRVTSEYSISFAGIPVARSKFKTLIDGKTLSVKGSLATAGLAAVFDSTTATSSSSGVISENGVETQSFALDYKSGKRSRSTRISFRNGNVVETVITPTRPPNPNNVPIEADQLRNVVDPFFASLISANDPSQVCNRTLKVFDGVLRINLVMRPSGREPYVVSGVKGEGVRCAVRYQPVGGHKLNSGAVKFLTEGERAIIVFGALPGTNLYGPVKATVKTKTGSVVIRATKFEQSVE
ncbi:MAG: DUF3108 domain-containing protein [Notoacmeibacter sp.]